MAPDGNAQTLKSILCGKGYWTPEESGRCKLVFHEDGWGEVRSVFPFSAVNVLTWQSFKALVRRRAERLGLCDDKVGVFETRAVEVCFAKHQKAALQSLRLTRFWSEYVA